MSSGRKNGAYNEASLDLLERWEMRKTTRAQEETVELSYLTNLLKFVVKTLARFGRFYSLFEGDAHCPSHRMDLLPPILSYLCSLRS